MLWSDWGREGVRDKSGERRSDGCSDAGACAAGVDQQLGAARVA